MAVAATLVGGYFAARGTGPAIATPVSNGSSGALELAGTDPVTGRQVDLASFSGKPLVVNVWGSWCEGCNAEAADLERFAQAHPEVQVVGIDTQDTAGGAKAFYAKWGWHHPSIADPHGELAARLGIQGTPTTFFLNSRHQIVTKVIGATNEAGFVQGLQAATHSTS
ncbi:MAG TPA: TlpA disulfide reductase family protein [Gaiellaceae bacterium]|nr:TlpA disulfide reductase family protein [Gaiellaceae bacterium]